MQSSDKLLLSNFCFFQSYKNNSWKNFLVQIPTLLKRSFAAYLKQSSFQEGWYNTKCEYPQTIVHLVNFSTNVSAMFDNHTILLLLGLAVSGSSVLNGLGVFL